MKTRREAAFYRPELDILRFCAFLGVYAVHAVSIPQRTLTDHHIPTLIGEAMTSLVRAGSYGVDLFFVLSAYLITELLEREKTATRTISLKSFYIRRILRIWPLYYFFLALAAAVPFLNPGREFGSPQVLLFAVFLGNWSFYFLGWAGYVAIPLWSLSVEEQFYLFWPPLMKRLPRRGLIAVAIGLIVIANLSRYLALWRHDGTRHIWTSTFAHLDSIGAGVLVSMWLKGKTPNLHVATRIAMLLAAVAAFAVRGHSVGLEPADRLYPWETIIQYPLVVVACAATLVAFLGMPVRAPALVYLGRISYGLYVYHLTCIFITDRLLRGDPGILHASLRIVISLGMTIAISALSYAFLEKPFLRIKRRFTIIESRPDGAAASLPLQPVT